MLPGKTYSAEDIVQIVRRRLWLLPLPIVTLFVALLYSASLPDVFQADMLIAIVPQRIPSEFVRSTVTLRTEERLDAITVQIMSRTVLEPLINEFDLYPEDRVRLPLEDVVQLMRNGIKIEIERTRPGAPEATAFHVRFTYPDAALAARVTQRLGSIFVDQNVRDRSALALATDDFLQVQLQEARARLETQEKRVEAFREKHGNELPTQLQSNIGAIQNAQLQIQAVVEAIARDRDRKLMLERLYQEAQNEPPPAAAPASVAGPQPAGALQTPAAPQQQLAAARTLLASLEMRLTPEHPDIVRTKRLIADLEPKVAAEEAQRLAGSVTDPAKRQPGPLAGAATPEEAQRRERMRAMRAEVESLDRQTQFKESEERRLRAVVAEYQRRIEAVPGIESEWAVMTRDYETQQTAYKELLTKSAASKLALDLENRQIGENFRVLDAARVPVKPTSPKRPQISGMGLAMGFVFMIAIAGFLEFRDSSFRSEADLVRLLAVPVLALVPFVETADERRIRMRRLMAVSAAAVVVFACAGYVFWYMRLWTVMV
jgi:polysaccharide chain length determinant protein (PEP-CTERM system associated)